MTADPLNLERLRTEHAGAVAQAEAMAEEIALREQAQLEEQAARRAEWDEQFVAGHRAQVREIEARSRQVRETFRQAVLDNPVFEAWIAMRADRWRRAVLAQQVQGSLVRLGREQEAARIAGLEYREPRLFEDVLEFVETEAQARAEDEGTERDEQREAHVMGQSS